MSKPGQPPPKPTKKHTREAVLRRAKDEGHSVKEEDDRVRQRFGATAAQDVQVFSKPRYSETQQENRQGNNNHDATRDYAPRDKYANQGIANDDHNRESPESLSSSGSDDQNSVNMHQYPTTHSEDSFSDSIRREDTFYTNEDNIRQMKERQDEERDAFRPHSVSQKSTTVRSSSSMEDDDMFSPHDANQGSEFNDEDDDVLLTSSNENFNQTQRIRRYDSYSSDSRNSKKSSSRQNTRQSQNSSDAFAYDPTPVYLSDDKFSSNPRISADTDNPFDELPQHDSQQDSHDFSDPFSEKANNPSNTPHESSHDEPPKSNRMLNIQSSTDSWGPLEPSTEGTDISDPFSTKSDSQTSALKPENVPHQPSPKQTSHDSDSSTDDVPVSNLVNQYFYTEENKKRKKQKRKEKLSKKKQEQDMQRELQELREQMQFFKSENEKLRKTRDTLMNDKQKLANEKIQFQKEIEREKEETEEWKQQEMKKIKKERRVLERQARANAQHMSRREQEKQIKSLQKQISSDARKHKQQTTKLKSEIDRLKEKLKSVEEERDAYKDSVRKVEMEKIDRQFVPKKKSRVEIVEPKRNNYVNESNDGARPKSQPSAPIRTHKSPGPSRRRSFPSSGRSNAVHPPQHQEPILEDQHQQYRAYVTRLKQQFDTVDSEQPPLDVTLSSRPIQTNQLKGGKTENIYRGNVREFKYQNGTVVRMFPNGYQKVLFTNGDAKESFASGKVVYYYYSADTTHTTLSNKLEVFEFPNGQFERHYPDPDGTKEINFPDGSIKYMNARFGNMYANR